MNLNDKFDEESKTYRRHNTQYNDTIIVFDDIMNTVMKWIDEEAIQHIAMMCPYTSHRPFLELLATKKSATIITTKDKYLQSRLHIFATWKSFHKNTILTLQTGKGKNTSIIHTKAIILLDQFKNPKSVIISSFNYSGGSSTNIEHAMKINDQRIAQTYLNEFYRVAKIATIPTIKNTQKKKKVSKKKKPSSNKKRISNNK